MSERQYVQHKSGQGEKWRLDREQPTSEPLWKVHGDGAYLAWLPKSEYVLCEPPERWVDVTEQCVIEIRYQSIRIIHNGCDVVGAYGVQEGYRLHKVPYMIGSLPRCAIIVERNEP